MLYVGEPHALEGPQKRGVLSLLGLCVGDSVGLPFELFLHRSNRQRVICIVVSYYCIV